MPIATVNPTTGLVEETFDAHDPGAVEEALSRAVRAQRDLRQRDFTERGQWMRRAADFLEDDLDTAAVMLTTEMGKPLAQSEAEVRKCAKGMRFYADHAADMLADTPLADPSAVGAGAAWTRWEPLGVVLAVMPWNFPLWQVVRFAAPALMAGNGALLKHASNVPRSAVYLEELFTRAGFPAGSFQTLLIASDAVAAVVDDPRVAAVTLTGSEPAGRAVAGRAGAALKKAVLELGGSDPFIVMPSADLETAVSTAVTSRTLNNGQSCVCAKRFVVHTDVFDAFTTAFTERMATLVVGDPLDRGTDIGPLATRSGRDELAELVEDAVTRGATLLTGGSVPDRDGWFYEPTVLTDLPDGARLVMEEAFGPVATLYRVEDREEAVEVANRTTFGLSSSLWTSDRDEQDWFTSRLEAGAVFVNGMTASYPELPFGGVKASGYGRELAAEGIREFCNLKTVWRA